jgi:hypothetical protein
VLRNPTMINIVWIKARQIEKHIYWYLITKHTFPKKISFDVLLILSRERCGSVSPSGKQLFLMFTLAALLRPAIKNG